MSGSDPGALPLDLKVAVQVIEQGRFEDARFRIVDHICRMGNSGKAHFALGLSFHKEKRYAPARDHFARAVQLDPEYPHTYYFQGYCLFYLGELDAARKSFETHLKARPDWADSIFGLGLIDLEQDKLDDAQKNFRRAIELNEPKLVDDPGNKALKEDIAKAYARLGDVFVNRDQLPEALESLRKATKLWPDHYEAWHKLSRVLYRLGDDEAAKKAEQVHIDIRNRIHPPTQPEASQP